VYEYLSVLLSSIIACAGLINPPGQPMLREIPYPSPGNHGSYLITWRPPLFTGGLTQLQYTYNVTIGNFFDGYSSLTTNFTSVIVHLLYDETSLIMVSVVNKTATTQQISKDSPLLLIISVTSECAGEGKLIIIIPYSGKFSHGAKFRVFCG
jgi:hypothetical protein